MTSRTAPGVLLVVDDDETNRDILARRLKRDGHHVGTAADGAQALQMVEAQPFDVVLLDIMMPVLDGYQVLERMKSDARLRDIPVIVLSAASELESVVRCIELGAEDYLPKPFEPVLLRAQRRHPCGKRQARRLHDHRRWPAGSGGGADEIRRWRTAAI